MNVLQEGQPSSDVRRGQLAAWHRNSNKDRKPGTHGGFRQAENCVDPVVGSFRTIRSK